MSNTSSDLNVFKQPRAFYLIFSVELWERFGYYGLQGILAIFLVKQMGLTEVNAISLFASFVALVNGFVSIGGYLGDKVLGTKRTLVIGAITLMIGYLFFAFGHSNPTIVYIGLATIAVGNGMFKANPSSLLSFCYDKKDPRLDGAFTMYYMSINIGAFFSMLMTPYLAANFGYSVAFSLSAVGMGITVLNFVFLSSWVKKYGSVPDFESVNIFKIAASIVLIIALIVISYFLLYNEHITQIVLYAIAAVVFFFFARETFRLHGIDRLKMIVAFVLIVEAIIFFVLYNQMPTSVNFFAFHNVSHSILGMDVHPEQYQALNPFFIMICSPILAIIYNKLGSKFPIPYKFAVGMMLCSFAFLVLPLGAKFANEHSIVSAYWLVLSYFLQSVGELLVSGLGLAMVASLVHEKLMGFIMGAYQMNVALASFLAGWVASFMALPEEKISSSQSLEIYSSVFLKIGIATFAIAIIMLILAKFLHGMTQEK